MHPRLFLLLGATLAYPALASPQSLSDPPVRPASLSVEVAAQAVLSGHPLLALQQAQVIEAQGFRLQASGVFDTQVNARFGQNWATAPLTAYQATSAASATFTGNVERSTTTTLFGSASRQFRNGIALGGTFELDRLLDSISGVNGDNLSTLNLVLDIPLLRNRGRSVVAAQETASAIEVRATIADTNQRASELVRTVALSFWTLLADQQNLSIAQASEARAREYLANVQTLAAADQVPQNDLNNVTANLAQRTLTRIADEQAVQAAQQQLSVDMGVSLPAGQSRTLTAGAEFPLAPAPMAVDAALGQDGVLLNLALARREDFLASNQRTDEQTVLLRAAQNRLKPQLDLTGNAGYTGLQPGRSFPDYFEAAAAGVRGPNAGAALVFSFPPRNEAAQGVLLTSTAALRQAEASRAQLRNTISAGVNTARSALVYAAGQVEQADIEVRASAAALTGEREKYRVGIGSIVDLVTVEDRVNAAQLNQVQSKLLYAVSLANLRFALGALVRSVPGGWLLEAQGLQVLPSPQAPATGTLSSP